MIIILWSVLARANGGDIRSFRLERQRSRCEERGRLFEFTDFTLLFRDVDNEDAPRTSGILLDTTGEMCREFDH